MLAGAGLPPVRVTEQLGAATLHAALELPGIGPYGAGGGRLVRTNSRSGERLVHIGGELCELKIVLSLLSTLSLIVVSEPLSPFPN